MAKKLNFRDYINVDYTQTGDPQLALNAKKRKEDVEPTDEALSMAARRKKRSTNEKVCGTFKDGP